MKTTKKSRTFSLRRIYNDICRIFSVILEDRVTVYAAQATFFIVISVIPFIMLLFSISRFILPDRFYDIIISFSDNIPGGIRGLYMTIIDELSARPEMQLISVTAVVTFWTASRGIAAVRGGVATVYMAPPRKNFLVNILISFAYTAIFIVLIIALLVILLFGEQLYDILSAQFTFLRSFKSLLEYRNLLFFCVLLVIFSLLYCTVGRRGNLPGRRLKDHLPGSIVAAAGWVLFSYIYSFYTLYFTQTSYIYGSLTAIILLMFWLYFCMIILLFGAEFNKFCSILQRKIKRKSEIKKEIIASGSDSEI